jgi:3-O-methylgallate 3,4-dioxygenase
MSRIIAGAGSSHSPMLAMRPLPMWVARGDADRTNPELYDLDGVIRSYAELERRAGDRYTAELTNEVWIRRFAQAEHDIERLGADLRALGPDLLVIVGDDQRELFGFANLPALSVYYGARVSTLKPDDGPGADAFFAEMRRGQGTDGRSYAGDAGAAVHLIEALIDDGFDVAASDAPPAGTGFGHAFGWVLGRLLPDAGIPAVPIMLNTYYPPNQPTPARCYDLGAAVERAVASLPGARRVAIVASGGLSHFVINPDLDHRVLDAMDAHDAAALRGLPPRLLNSGSSEIRNWLVVAGAATGLAPRWRDYIPAYRTAAGTGTGLGFALWA